MLQISLNFGKYALHGIIYIIKHKGQNNMKRYGFTLAEVLITLGIIGLVAALTIPTLIENAQEQAAVSRVKKTYALITQAVTQWQNDSNCLGDTANCAEAQKGYAAGSAAIARALAKNLKVVNASYGPTDAEAAQLDWLPDQAYDLTGTPQNSSCFGAAISNSLHDYERSCSYLQLVDGTILQISGWDWKYGCYGLEFDINGKKGPNRVGKDQFTSSLATPLHKGLTPFYYRYYCWAMGYVQMETSLMI